MPIGAENDLCMKDVERAILELGVYDHKTWKDGAEKIFKGQQYFKRPVNGDSIYVFYYRDGAIALHIGKPDFPPEWYEEEGIAKALCEGKQVSAYPASTEAELKMLLSKAVEAP